MRNLYLDLETISTVSVVHAGLYAHADDPTLDITMAAWAVDDAPDCRLWMDAPQAGTASEPPQELLDHLNDPDTLVWAHNAAYERIVMMMVWGVVVPMHRWRDSAVVARWYNMPAALEGFSKYMLGPKAAKLDSGDFKYLWGTASLPWTDADMPAFKDMGVYCVRDVEAMRDSVLQLPPLPDSVWEEYAASERINDRGVTIDLPFAEAAAELRSAADADAQKILSEMTDGALTTPRGPGPRRWVQEQLAATHPELLDDDGQLTRGFKKRRTDRVGFYTETRPTFDKPMRRKIREHLHVSDTPAAPNVLDVLDAVDEGQNAAITKYASAARRVSADGRLRGMYIFAGASQTHRYSSTGVQTHNMLRDMLDLDEDADLRDAVLAAQGDLDPLLRLPSVQSHGFSRSLSMALRGTLKSQDPDTHDLGWADWSAIEARALPWLASDHAKLDMFRSGRDPYKVNANALFHVPYDEVSKDQRQCGKVQELSLGYGGGAGAFEAMSRGYNVHLPPETVKKAVYTWRDLNPNICGFWKVLERAAFEAIRRPCAPIPAGRYIHYVYAPNVAYGSLLVALPCGSMLVYPNARIEQVERFEDQPAEPAICFDHPAYGRSSLWHGTLVENITQAVCASLLRDAVVGCDAEGLKVVCHTHDELVIESPVADMDEDLATLTDIMQTPPAWAGGLPLAAEGGRGSRYKIDGAAY